MPSLVGTVTQSFRESARKAFCPDRSLEGPWRLITRKAVARIARIQFFPAYAGYRLIREGMGLGGN